ncbi:putative solute carrier family 13 [Helianthus debilis subsp. tardiflorus]
MGCMVQSFLFPGVSFSYADPTHGIQNISARNKYTANAPIMAKNKLEQMGPVKRNEWMMMGTMLVTVPLWIFRERLDISTLAVAMMGLSVLLILRVHGRPTKRPRCHTMVVWTCSHLHRVFTSWMVYRAFYPPVDVLLHSLYLVAAQTTHIVSLYQAFLKMHLTAKVPGTLSALHLACNATLFGALTHYSSGQSTIYYGARGFL